jgi:hypothetical protein
MQFGTPAITRLSRFRSAIIDELSRAIYKDGRKFGSPVKRWITTNAPTVVDQDFQAETPVGTTILLEYIKRILVFTDVAGRHFHIWCC